VDGVAYAGAAKAMVLFSRRRARLHGEESIPPEGEASEKSLRACMKPV
jgi:hypothetical protein